jgi:hypothetical protein
MSSLIDNSAFEFQKIYISDQAGTGNVGGLSYADEDIIIYDELTGSWSMYFDGSDVGLGGSKMDVDTFHLNPDGSLLLHFNQIITLPGVGEVTGNDLVRFIPSRTGTDTAGTYEWYFDGSDVGLETDGERIDALTLNNNGQVIISTNLSPFVPGHRSPTLRDEDLLIFTPTSLGADTSGTWAQLTNGSEMGLGDLRTEDVDGVDVSDSGFIYFSTEGTYSIPGASGGGADLFVFDPITTGEFTTGPVAPFWSGPAHGFAGNIDDFTIV